MTPITDPLLLKSSGWCPHLRPNKGKPASCHCGCLGQNVYLEAGIKAEPIPNNISWEKLCVPTKVQRLLLSGRDQGKRQRQHPGCLISARGCQVALAVLVTHNSFSLVLFKCHIWNPLPEAHSLDTISVALIDNSYAKFWDDCTLSPYLHFCHCCCSSVPLGLYTVETEGSIWQQYFTRTCEKS